MEERPTIIENCEDLDFDLHLFEESDEAALLRGLLSNEPDASVFIIPNQQIEVTKTNTVL